MKKTLVLFLCILAIAYLITSFVLWQFNPHYWEPATRFLVVYLVFACLFIYIFANV